MLAKFVISAALLVTGITEAATNYWKTNTNYPVNTEVVYNNTLWVALQANLNSNPGTNQDHNWRRIGALIKPASTPTPWESSSAYAESATVIYNNGVWQATTANFQKTPSLNNTAWTKTADLTVTPSPGATPVIYWQANKIYVANTTVVYNNTTWLARWYTQGETPGSVGSAWVKVSANTVTPRPTASQITPVITPKATITAAAIPTTAQNPRPSTNQVASLTPIPTSAATPVSIATPNPAPSAKPTPQPIKRIFNLNKPNQLTAKDLQSIDREPLISTGLWVNATDTITISYYNQSIAPESKPSILVHDLNEEVWDNINDQNIELNVGTTVLQIAKSGFLFIETNNKPTSREMIIEIVSGGQIAK